jgi:hypothetical protein
MSLPGAYHVALDFRQHNFWIGEADLKTQQEHKYRHAYIDISVIKGLTLIVNRPWSVWPPLISSQSLAERSLVAFPFLHLKCLLSASPCETCFCAMAKALIIESRSNG